MDAALRVAFAIVLAEDMQAAGLGFDDSRSLVVVLVLVPPRLRRQPLCPLLCLDCACPICLDCMCPFSLD